MIEWALIIVLFLWAVINQIALHSERSDKKMLGEMGRNSLAMYECLSKYAGLEVHRGFNFETKEWKEWNVVRRIKGNPNGFEVLNGEYKKTHVCGRD